MPRLRQARHRSPDRGGVWPAARLKYPPTYRALVEVARAQIVRMTAGGRRMLTDAKIRKLVSG
jgi:hypothetical protein